MAKKYKNNSSDEEEQLSDDAEDVETSSSNAEVGKNDLKSVANDIEPEDEESVQGDAANQNETSSSEGEDEKSELDLDASNTESDDDDDDGVQKDSPPTKNRAQLEEEKLLKKYEERQGKQLYVRFPTKLPEDEEEFQQKARSLSTLIVKAHKPRQKYAHFCLVDFNSKTDRDTALKAIKEAKATDEAFKKVVVSIPRTENVNFVKEMVERRLKSLENKRAKLRLKRESKNAISTKNFTSSIVVLNIPPTASMIEVRKLFPNAVDVQMKPGKGKRLGTGLATITLPSTMEARAAVKQKLTLNGVQLIVRYDKQTQKRRQPWTPEAHRIALNAKKNKMSKTPLKSKKSKQETTVEKSEFKAASKPTKNKAVTPIAAPKTKHLKRAAAVDDIKTAPYKKLKKTAVAITAPVTKEKKKKNLKSINKVEEK